MATPASGGIETVVVNSMDPAKNVYIDQRVVNQGADQNYVHTDAVYAALINAAAVMENRLTQSLENYQNHPDVQANLQQLQYDLQSWNLALTTMTNIQKNMADALKSISSNFR